MKPMNPDNRELLEDIFAPEHPSSEVSAEEVLRLVQQAREARQRRRRFSAAAALFLASAVWAVTFLPGRSTNSTNSSRTQANVPVPSAPIASASSITPPIVEHVDDEHMLALLDETPAALVRWPDGRRTLLLLVANPPAN
jgi:hypothetical protein